MNAIRKTKIVVLSILFPAMILLAGNAVFNWHVHNTEKGALYIHAHPDQVCTTSQCGDVPVNKSPKGNNHSHNSHECFSINHITSFLFVVIAVFCLASVVAKTSKVKIEYCIHVNGVFLNSLLPARAPPISL